MKNKTNTKNTTPENTSVKNKNSVTEVSFQKKKAFFFYLVILYFGIFDFVFHR